MLFMEDAQEDEKKLVGLVGEKKREIDETSASKILLTYFTDPRERQKRWDRTMSGTLSYFLITKKFVRFQAMRNMKILFMVPFVFIQKINLVQISDGIALHCAERFIKSEENICLNYRKFLSVNLKILPFCR